MYESVSLKTAPTIIMISTYQISGECFLRALIGYSNVG